MQNRFFWPGLIVFTAVLAGLFAWTGISNPLSSIIIFAFIFVIPGLAFTRLFHFVDSLAEIVLAIAISLVISTIMAEFMVFAHLWMPKAGLGFLIAISLLGAGLQILNRSSSAIERGADDNDHQYSN